jgi:phosphatidylglycerol:prolipoprotein diacylglycerol transferase
MTLVGACFPPNFCTGTDEYMLPTVNFFGKDISTYGLMALLGFCFCFGFLFIRKSNVVKKEDLIYSTLYALLFLGVGGKLLYLIITLFQIRDLSLLTFDLFVELVKGGGYVWYGAFFGGILGYYVYCRKFRINFSTLMENTIFIIPLGHFFGRLGCFCAGCCYGIPFPTPVGVYFSEDSLAPHDVPLLPTQLIEAVFNLFLFLIILRLSKKTKRRYTLYSVYAFSYGIFRFLIEFLRYDHHRGTFLFLSTSQWLSIVLIITAVVSMKKQ